MYKYPISTISQLMSEQLTLDGVITPVPAVLMLFTLVW